MASETAGLTHIEDWMEQMWAELEQRWAKDEAWEADPSQYYTLPDQPSWEDIVAREPRLAALEPLAERGYYQDKQTYTFWCKQIKPQIVRLVGWDADQPPPLRTSAAYDCVYQHLLHIYDWGVKP